MYPFVLKMAAVKSEENQFRVAKHEKPVNRDRSNWLRILSTPFERCGNKLTNTHFLHKQKSHLIAVNSAVRVRLIMYAVIS